MIKLKYQGMTEILEIADFKAILEDSKLPWFCQGSDIYILGQERDLVLQGEQIWLGSYTQTIM